MPETNDNPNEWEERDDMDSPDAETEWKIHERLSQLTGPHQPIQIPQDTRPKISRAIEGALEETDGEIQAGNVLAPW